MAQTATMGQWQAAWDQIHEDYESGKIIHSTFTRERNYMLGAKRQIEELRTHNQERDGE